MPSKRVNTFNVILISTVVVGVGYVLSTPWLPIKLEVKQSLGYPKDSLLNFTELTGRYGYSSEEHTVVTEDAYILSMFRIAKAKNCHKRKRSPPVLMMHGLLLSSHTWIDSGPNAGLAYLLADACYDVWLGNTRGNYYGRRHMTLNPDTDKKFWDFYIEEIGKYDVPAMIDYILDNTGFDKLNYVGFSQGCGTFFVMCSERPEYCDKVQLMTALAPASRQYHTQSKIFRAVTQLCERFENSFSLYGLSEVFGAGSVTQEFFAFFCQLSDITESICETLMNVFDHVHSSHPGSITNDTTRVLVGHFPAGTSLHNMARYGQSMKTKRFQKFDYGSEQNLVVYGSEEPPEYKLSAVKVPVLCLYGKNDGLVDTKDVAWLMSRLPNVLEVMPVDDPHWNHMDMTYSQYTSYAIFPKVHEYLLKYTEA
ncbi:unnamed protein product [Chrysodeixis includens]|uniref:Lipase n=1 Tax=Chrysodeixis includens TaxID=689277 RepID=A0A9P0BUQ1_CHRIL|nr:unnamed protein product [Chrysodeixis includens]